MTLLEQLNASLKAEGFLKIIDSVPKPGEVPAPLKADA